jgi:hypothetical protein
MAKSKPASSRRTKRASALKRLQPSEAQEVLDSLLKAHPELRKEAEGVARSLIAEVSFEEVAEQVEWALAHLGLDDLGDRAGKHSWGYVGPTEAAWELLQEAIDPFIAELDRQLELGLWRQALETCKGLVLGLYEVRNKQSDGCLGWAPDFAGETAAEALKKWLGGQSGRKKVSFPSSFVDEHVPKWKALIDPVLSG